MSGLRQRGTKGSPDGPGRTMGDNEEDRISLSEPLLDNASSDHLSSSPSSSPSSSSSSPITTNTASVTSSVTSAVTSSRFTCLTLSIVVFQIVCEVTKQLTNYSTQYLNHGKYPVPQTVIVVVMEMFKLVATIIRAKGSVPSFSWSSLRSSLRFLVPSVLYALNNNIYFIGLTLVPPPIWLILCSIRTAITASIYKFILKRNLSVWQFFGAFLIVLSIVMAKLPDLLGGKHAGVNYVPITAILLAAVASTNSVCAGVYTETLFKSQSVKGETFLDQQFWLYFYGMVVASVGHFASNATYGIGSLARDVAATPDSVFAMLLVAMLIGSLGGLVTAAILKMLDNIVKEYSGNLANVLTAIFCSFLFPDKFQFTIYILFSLGFLFTGIYLYENKKAPSNQTAAGSKPGKGATPLVEVAAASDSQANGGS